MRIVLETYLALANEADPMGDGVPDHVENELRGNLRCGILAHGFARARYSSCGHNFLMARVEGYEDPGDVLPAP